MADFKIAEKHIFAGIKNNGISKTILTWGIQM
jgi:hypothetical protein